MTWLWWCTNVATVTPTRPTTCCQPNDPNGRFSNGMLSHNREGGWKYTTASITTNNPPLKHRTIARNYISYASIDGLLLFSITRVRTKLTWRTDYCDTIVPQEQPLSVNKDTAAVFGQKGMYAEMYRVPSLQKEET